LVDEEVILKVYYTESKFVSISWMKSRAN